MAALPTGLAARSPDSPAPEAVHSDPLAGTRRLTVKIGSALLVDPKRGLREEWLAGLVDDLAALRGAGTDILVVSSGAVALGRTLLRLPSGSLKLEESQAAAAAGQIALAGAWAQQFARHGFNAGQVLVTLDDTEERRRYLNARATVGTLLKLGAVPVINENDTVATAEIRYGDNDRLAARIATMAKADMLVLLSDIDGLYTAPPSHDPSARHIAIVDQVTPQIEAMGGGAASELSRGGMRTKIDAARMATMAGTAMIIASGKRDNPLSAIRSGARHTLFRPMQGAPSAWKRWIAGQFEPSGRLTIDAGALSAIADGKSLLAAGVRHVEGRFERGDAVSILHVEDGREVARGVAGYGSDDARIIAGLRSGQIEDILGYPPRSAMVHRDDLVIL